MDITHLTEDISVETVMEIWPETIRTFVRKRMACVGCPIAQFHTVRDVAQAYSFPPHGLLHDLRSGIDGRTD